MVHLNWFAIIVLSIVAFVGGAVWFSVFFGKIWTKIHGADKLTKSEMEKMTVGMWKIMLAEFVSVVMMIMSFDFLRQIIPGYSGMHIGFLVWFGFVLPTYISSIVWGKDPKKWMLPKILISAGYRLLMLIGAGYVLGIW